MNILFHAPIDFYFKHSKISDPEMLSMFNNLTFQEGTVLDNVSDEFISALDFSSLKGGNIGLTYDAEANKVNVLASFELGREVTEDDTQALGRVVLQQLGSGLGQQFSAEIEEISQLRMALPPASLQCQLFE